MFKPSMEGFHQATPEEIVSRILRGDIIHYTPDYHCCLLIALFIQGHDIAAFCGWNGMGRRTFYEWLERYPDFAATYETAKELSRIWYEQKGHEGMDDPSFNTKMWAIFMKNKFGYSETRALKIAGMDKAKNFNEQIQLIAQSISKGSLTGQEVNQAASFVATAAKVDEVTELRKDVEMLKGIQNGG